jgi:hypothetical protein
MTVAEQAYKQGIRKVTLGFSTGKDSVAGLDLLLKAGIEVIPIYFYIVPGLGFVEKNLKRYEEHFGVKIVRMPHPILYDYINHQDWQPFDRAKNLSQFNLGVISFKNCIDMYLLSNGLKGYDYDCNCMKMSDSLNRRLLLRNKPDINHETKTIYLTKYFTTSQIFDYLKKNGIPLTDDYRIFGRSWDGLSYHFTLGVKKYYPEDYELIKSYWPLIDAEVMRYNIVKNHECVK